VLIMKALVTGATGFIGGNLVRELLKQGYQVRALVRKGSSQRNIGSLDVDVVLGDLRDRDSLEKALEGCDVLFHVAAAYTFWCPDPKVVYETNVKGTENILAAARDKRIKKVIYTSTESTIGIADGCLGTEAMEASLDCLPGHYKKSKYLAEKLALKMCQQGLPLVVVNPTMPVGSWDIKPTPTGQVIVDFLNCKMPACVNTGLNVVDVNDVARGHILALEKGRLGERYILGNRNLTLREILAILERITGIKAPRFDIPIWLALGAAHVDELVSGKVFRRRPRIPLEAVRAACKFRHFDCSKAVHELGFPQTPVEEAFDKAVKWFRQNGYVG
jgi:dihydroflavonol-4-reductase